MKVKELIEKLSKLNQNATVLIKSENFELNNAKVPISAIWEFETGSTKEKTFFDAFDGDSYKKEVWDIIGGNKSIVILH